MIYKFLAIGLLGILFISNIYRAATQSIVHDEALTYLWFASQPVSYLFTAYSANHHVLNSLLVKLSIKLFGLSEFAVRVPSLLGGLLYLTTAYRLSRILFKNHLLFLLAIGLLTLNPFILDFLVAARGYGLALGFCLWASYHLACYLSPCVGAGNLPPATHHLIKASLGMGLSVSCNLTFLYINFSLAVVFILIDTLDHTLSADVATAKKHIVHLVRIFCLPGIIVAAMIVTGPLSKAVPGDFYFGSTMLSQTLDGLLSISLCHHSNTLFLTGACPQIEKHMWLIEVIVIAIILSTAATAILALYRGFKMGSLAKTRTPVAFVLLGGAFSLCIFLILLSHYLFGILYPKDRTGIYLVPFFVLCFLCQLQYFSRSPKKYAVLLTPLYLILGLTVIQFAAQFNLSHFAIWRYDAGTKRIFALINEGSPHDPGKEVHLGIDWLYEPSINFYREMYHAGWIKQVDKSGPEGDFDYYVLVDTDVDPTFTAEHERLNNKKRLKVIYCDEVSGTKLEVPMRSN